MVLVPVTDTVAPTKVPAVLGVMAGRGLEIVVTVSNRTSSNQYGGARASLRSLREEEQSAFVVELRGKGNRDDDSRPRGGEREAAPARLELGRAGVVVAEARDIQCHRLARLGPEGQSVVAGQVARVSGGECASRVSA